MTVVVGAERHESIDLSLRFLGLGPARSRQVAVDDEGRIRLDALAETLDAAGGGPLIVCLQAGNVHSGGYDPLGEAIDLAHRYGAWVHVDGAFGLWAAASPRLRHLTAGMVRADSWATDAHKTLNVPYDCGMAIVADTDAMYAAMGMHAAYLIQDERPDPFSSVPEFSRRARGFTVWAALRSLGVKASPRWSRGSAPGPGSSPTVCRRWTAYGWSTTWCSPRSARRSGPTR